MEIDLDTSLTALYCVVDDVYQAEFACFKPRRRGHRPELSDSEVLTLALLGQWQSEWATSRFLGYAAKQWHSYFPRLLHRTAFERRCRDLGLVLARLGPSAVRRPVPLFLVGAYELPDGIPVPLTRRCRGDRHRLFADDASIGRGGSDRDWYYELKLVAAVSPTGIITGFVLAPASTEERWDVDALLRWRADPTAPAPTAAELAPLLRSANRAKGRRQGPTGPLRGRGSAGSALTGWHLADEGARGIAWRRHWWEDYGAAVTPLSAWKEIVPSIAHPVLAQTFHTLRQMIETVYASLDGTFGLKFPRARTPWSIFVRTAAKVAAHDLMLVLNQLFHRPLFSVFHPITE